MKTTWGLALVWGGGPEMAMEMDPSKAADAASGSLKNFRHHPDIENFYRFIAENDLRYEALGIIDVILVDKQNRKKAKLAKSQAH